MMPGAPTELDPYLVCVRIREALHRMTVLRAMDDDFLGGRTVPSQITHQRFRLESRRFEFRPQSKARPGDVVMLTEHIAVLICHELNEADPESSKAIAAQDFISALKGLLCARELSGIGQPIAGGAVARTSRQRIEFDLLVQVQYHVTIPATPES